MKKLIKKLSFFVLVLTSLSSCHDALNVMPEGMLQYDDIFNNEVSTGAYLNNCYYQLPPGGLSYTFWSNGPNVWSDNAHEYGEGSTNVASKVYQGINTGIWDNTLISNTNYIKQGKDTSWNIYYRNIRKCNLFLSWIDRAAVPSEPERAEWKAEIRTLRAYYYMELLVRFGDVPLITEVYDITYGGEDLFREKFNVVADFVISECREALKCEEFPWRAVVGDNRERMTRAVAAGVMSRTALFKASPLFNGGENYWAEAEAITKEALDLCLANGYELYTTASVSAFEGNAYYEYITSDYVPGLNPVDKESILMFSHSSIASTNLKRKGPPLFASNAGMCPTQEFVDAFPMTDGSYVLDLDNPYNDEYHLEPNYNANSSYDPKNPYKNRDPRFHALVIYNGRKFQEFKKREIQTYNGGADGIKMADPKRTCTGYYYGKTIRADASLKNKQKFGFRNIRLADLYLNHAEAAAENGNVAAAVESVRPIRDRVGMPNINPTSQEDAITMIRNERRIEFGQDEQRYYDVRRWTYPGDDMPVFKHVTGMWIEKLSDGSFEYHRVRVGQSYDKATGEFIGNPWERNNYTSKYTLEPLELNEVVLLEGTTGLKWQNPGW